MGSSLPWGPILDPKYSTSLFFLKKEPRRELPIYSGLTKGMLKRYFHSKMYAN